MENKQEEGAKEIVTKGGFKALLVNNQIIRKSSSPRRIIEDEETYDEYKVRLKLVKQLEKEQKGKIFWMSKFSIGKQSYSSQYIKKKKEVSEELLEVVETKKVSEDGSIK